MFRIKESVLLVLAITPIVVGLAATAYAAADRIGLRINIELAAAVVLVTSITIVSSWQRSHRRRCVG